MKVQSLTRVGAPALGLSIVLCGAVLLVRANAAPPMKMPMPASHARHSAGASPFAQAMQRSMTTMHKNMMAKPMTGNPDRDFANMMIPHHQGAVEMAQVELRYGKDPALRRLAEQIIRDQRQEIALMQRQLKKLPAK